MSILHWRLRSCRIAPRSPTIGGTATAAPVMPYGERQYAVPIHLESPCNLNEMHVSMVCGSLMTLR